MQASQSTSWQRLSSKGKNPSALSAFGIGAAQRRHCAIKARLFFGSNRNENRNQQQKQSKLQNIRDTK